MKLSEILGRILTDVALRQKFPDWGVCALVDHLSGYSMQAERRFEDARRACTQTDSYVYPVLHSDRDKRRASADWGRARREGTMWRGEYGMNRRKLVRDCWRWAKERGL